MTVKLLRNCCIVMIPPDSGRRKRRYSNYMDETDITLMLTRKGVNLNKYTKYLCEYMFLIQRISLDNRYNLFSHLLYQMWRHKRSYFFSCIKRTLDIKH